jgi:hypothetical protein
MRCTYCGKWYDPSRCIGWSRLYCQPLCERKHGEARAESFAKWWNRNFFDNK